MSEVNPSSSSSANAPPEKSDPQEAYAQWLQTSYGNLHEAVWHGHNVFWTTTSIFVPVIATATGYLISREAKDLTPGRAIGLYFLVIAVTWFWYGMFLILRKYNVLRLKRLHAIEDQLNAYYQPKGPLKEFHYYSEDEDDRRQYRGRLSLAWFFVILPVLVTVIMVILIDMALAAL